MTLVTFQTTNQEAVVGLIVWQLDVQLPMQPVSITTKVVSLNPSHGDVNSIMFDSDLRQVGVFFLPELQFSSPIKLTTTYNFNIFDSGD